MDTRQGLHDTRCKMLSLEVVGVVVLYVQTARVRLTKNQA